VVIDPWFSFPKLDSGKFQGRRDFVRFNPKNEQTRIVPLRLRFSWRRVSCYVYTALYFTVVREMFETYQFTDVELEGQQSGPSGF